MKIFYHKLVINFLFQWETEEKNHKIDKPLNFYRK